MTPIVLPSTTMVDGERDQGCDHDRADELTIRAGDHDRAQDADDPTNTGIGTILRRGAHEQAGDLDNADERPGS